MGCFGYGGFGSAGGLGSHYGFSLFGAGLGLITHIAILALLVFAAIYFYKNALHNSSQTKQNTALEILQSRFAKGELTAQEFQEMKKQL